MRPTRCGRWTRALEDVVDGRVALTIQLRSELERFWSGPIGLFGSLDSAIALAFLERCPSPADARGLSEQRLAGFLKRQHYPVARSSSCSPWSRRSGRWSPRSSSSSARSPPPCASTRTARSSSRCSKTQQRDHSRQAAVGDRRLPRVLPTRDALAAGAGQAAVAIESGKRKAACFGWGCNKRLRCSFGPERSQPEWTTPGGTAVLRATRQPLRMR